MAEDIHSKDSTQWACQAGRLTADPVRPTEFVVKGIDAHQLDVFVMLTQSVHARAFCVMSTHRISLPLKTTLGDCSGPESEASKQRGASLPQHEDL